LNKTNKELNSKNRASLTSNGHSSNLESITEKDDGNNANNKMDNENEDKENKQIENDAGINLSPIVVQQPTPRLSKNTPSVSRITNSHNPNNASPKSPSIFASIHKKTPITSLNTKNNLTNFTRTFNNKMMNEDSFTRITRHNFDLTKDKDYEDEDKNEHQHQIPYNIVEGDETTDDITDQTSNDNNTTRQTENKTHGMQLEESELDLILFNGLNLNSNKCTNPNSTKSDFFSFTPKTNSPIRDRLFSNGNKNAKKTKNKRSISAGNSSKRGDVIKSYRSNDLNNNGKVNKNSRTSKRSSSLKKCYPSQVKRVYHVSHLDLSEK
jgi:hypothetical protein